MKRINRKRITRQLQTLAASISDAEQTLALIEKMGTRRDSFFCGLAMPAFVQCKQSRAIINSMLLDLGGTE